MSGRRGFVLVGLTAIVVLGVAALLAWSGGSGGSRRTSALASPRLVRTPWSPAVQLPAGRGRRGALAPGSPDVTPATAPADFYPDVYRPGQVLVGFRAGVSARQRRAIERSVGAYSAKRLGPPIKPAGHGRVTGPEFLAPFELRVPTSEPVLSVVRRLRHDHEVAYAEPNYLEAGDSTPNDPSFGVEWWAHNTGQAIPFQEQEEVLGAELAGTPGAEDHALKAWNVTTGSRSIVIGEVDTGIDLTHPDLAANIWSNSGNVFKEQKCAAGTHGYNVVSDTCVPEDEDELYKGHGTHVAGIMGAVGNNGEGVAGMNWQTTILPIKWMHSAGSGETSKLIEALQFEVKAEQEGVNVRVVNDSDSFYGTAQSEALENEIEVLGANNILFVTSAGNTGNDNDEAGEGKRYPCASAKADEICVTATNNKDELPSWANYGPKTVQLGAPGVSIYSTDRENGYRYLTGGSMAAPQVSGAAALILSVLPSLTAAELKSRILNSVEKLPSLEGKVETGGILDVCKAIPGCEHEATKVPSPAGVPKLSGTAQSGQTLTATSGEWTEEPTSFAYRWERCNGRGEACKTIEGASASTYTLTSADVGSRLRVAVTATNLIGSSAAPQISEPTTVPVKPTEVTCGKTSVGATAEGLAAERKRVNRCELTTAQAIQRLEVYLQPSGTSGQELFEGVVYAESSGAPGALLGTTSPLTFKSTNAAGWYELPFATALNLASGKYWIGFITGPTSDVADFRYESVEKSRDYNSNAYASGPSNPFGTVTSDSRLASVYAGSTSLGRPVNVVLPWITGSPQSREKLTANAGSWAESPTGYAYQWQRCNSAGESCTNIEGATEQTYTLGPADVHSTLRVAVTASNATGPSPAESSKQTAVVTANTPTAVGGKGPTIKGVAEDEQTLTAETGTWTESPTSFKYQWETCNKSGEACNNISGATSSTYVLKPTEVGDTLRVIVTAKNGVGETSATSEKTAVVVAAPPSVVEGKGPTIKGTAEDGQR